eukprot:TRINITY_DN519_c0_g1_i2.p1 TRINITY_DN519_c0_g1~~TRINITY_DN519_c0_g1_i2.p1  ORF type:complete len:865 (-),score=90.26 TRINITY_DN519_c0_g1_i2:143-2737(-)
MLRKSRPYLQRILFLFFFITLLLHPILALNKTISDAPASSNSIRTSKSTTSDLSYFASFYSKFHSNKTSVTNSNTTSNSRSSITSDTTRINTTVSHTTSNTTSTTSNKNATFTLGIVVPPEALFSHSRNVCQMAVDTLNAQNFLPNSYKINLIAVPGPSPGAASSAVRTLVKMGAIGIIGPYNSIQAVIAAETSSILKTPIISPAAGSTSLSDPLTYRFFIRANSNFYTQTDALIKALLFLKVKDVAIIGSTQFADYVEIIFAGLTAAEIKVLSLLYYVAEEEELIIERTQTTGARMIMVVLPSYQLIPFSAALKSSKYYGHPFVFFLMSSQLLGILTQVNGSVFQGSFGVSLNQIPDPTIPIAQQYLNLASQRLNSPPTDIDALSWDTVYTFAYAIRDLLNQSVPVDEIKNEVLFKACLNVSFIGVSGLIQYQQSGSRVTHQLTIINAVKNKTVNPSGLIGKTVLVIEPNNQTREVAPIIFPDGTSKVPDFTPRQPVNYYSCEKKRIMTDKLGLIKFSDEILEEDWYCDEVIQCDNNSDEDSSCDPSLFTAEIALTAIAASLMVIVILLYLIILWHHERSRVKHFGLMWISLMMVASLMGLSAVFPFYGKNTVVRCWFRAILPAVAAGIFVTLLSLRLVWWLRKRVVGPNPQPPYSVLNTTPPNSRKNGLGTSEGNNNSGKDSNSNGTTGVTSGTTDPDKDGLGDRWLRDKSMMWTDSQVWTVSVLMMGTILLLNIIILIIMLSVTDMTEDKRCGDKYIMIWVGVLLVINALPLVFGCFLSWFVARSRIRFHHQKLVILALYHALCLGIFMSCLYFSTYSLILVQRVIVIVFIILFFFNSYIIITVPIVFRIFYTPPPTIQVR